MVLGSFPFLSYKGFRPVPGTGGRRLRSPERQDGRGSSLLLPYFLIHQQNRRDGHALYYLRQDATRLFRLIQGLLMFLPVFRFWHRLL